MKVVTLCISTFWERLLGPSAKPAGICSGERAASGAAAAGAVRPGHPAALGSQRGAKGKIKKRKRKGQKKKYVHEREGASVLLRSRPRQLAQGDRCHMTDNSRARQSCLRWEQPRSVHGHTHAHTRTCVPALLDSFFPVFARNKNSNSMRLQK